MATDLQLKLKIDSDPAGAVKGLQATEDKLNALTGEVDKAKVEADKLKEAYIQTGVAVEKIGKNLAQHKAELKALTDSGVSKTSTEYVTLKAKVNETKQALANATGELKTQTREYETARTGVERSEAAISKLTKTVEKQREMLTAAGVDVKNLEQEYERLSQVQRQANARETLGVKPFADIEAEIHKVKAAFETLKASGTLSQSEIAQAALKTQQRIDELKHSTNGWTDALIQAKAKFVEAGIAAGGLTAAAHQAIQFETALAQVAKTTGMSAAETQKLGEQIKAMSGYLPKSADELAGMAAAAGQLGIANKDIKEFVELAAKMASAFDIPAEQAGDAIAKLTNNFQLSIPQVAKLGDAINALGNTTAAKEKDIVDALSRIGGNAKQFGLSAEEAAALSAALLAMGMPAEQAATAINAMLSKLQTARVGTKEFQEGLDQLGLSANRMADAVKANPQKALSDLLHTLDKLDAQARAEVLSRLFGAEHSDEIARLVNGVKSYDQALGLVANTTQTTGAMQKEFDAKLATTQAHLDLLKNSIEVAGINLGQVFLPAIRDVADGLKTATQAVAEFEHAFPGIAGLAATLATLAASVGALRIAWLALASVGAKPFDWMKDIGPVTGKSIGEATEAVSKFKLGLGLLSSLMVGLDIGTWARREFEFVYQAGVATAAGLTRLAETVQYKWEYAKATFSKDDTLAAATKRHEERLRKIDDAYGELFTQWKAGTEGQAKATEAVEKATEKLPPALKDAQQAMGGVVGASEKLNAAMKEAEGHVKVIEAQATSTQGLIKAHAELARALGEESKAFQLAGELKSAEYTAAQSLAEAKAQLAAKAKEHADWLQQEASAEKTQIAEAQADVQVKQQQAEAAKQQADALGRLPASIDDVAKAQTVGNAELMRFKEAAAQAIDHANQLAATQKGDAESQAKASSARADAIAKLTTYTEALKDHAEQLNLAAEKTQRETSLISQQYDVRLKQLDALKHIATARGDENEVTKISIEIAQVEARQAQAVAQAKQLEAQAINAKVQAVIAESKADGIQNQAELAAIDAAKANAQAKQLEAQAAQATADAKTADAQAAQQAAKSTGDHAEKTKDATQSTKELAAATNDAAEAVYVLNGRLVDGSGYGGIENTKAAAKELTGWIEQAAKQSERLKNGLSEYELKGAVAGANELADKLEKSAIAGLDSASAARSLRDAVQQAKDNAKQLQESLTETASRVLSDLNKDLAYAQAQAKGATQEQLQALQEQQSYQEKRMELEKQLKQAKDAGAKEAAQEFQQALVSLNQLHQTKLQTLQKESGDKASQNHSNPMKNQDLNAPNGFNTPIHLHLTGKKTVTVLARQAEQGDVVEHLKTAAGLMG